MKLKKNISEDALGFPVIISEAYVDARREIIHIDYEALSVQALQQLARVRRRLTGSEVRFVRSFFGFTLAAFAERFAYTHPAVKGWEERRDRPTKMMWSTEKDLRLFILASLGSTADDILSLYLDLVRENDYPEADVPEPLRVEGTLVLPEGLSHDPAGPRPRSRAAKA